MTLWLTRKLSVSLLFQLLGVQQAIWIDIGRWLWVCDDDILPKTAGERQFTFLRILLWSATQSQNWPLTGVLRKCIALANWFITMMIYAEVNKTSSTILTFMVPLSTYEILCYRSICNFARVCWIRELELLTSSHKAGNFIPNCRAWHVGGAFGTTSSVLYSNPIF
jgi:hypothetical protein